MGKSKAQGTRWETKIVKAAKAQGLDASRLPLQGQKNEPDVEIAPNHGWSETFVALFWKRLTPSKGGQRRSPDGVGEVVVMEMDQFLHLYELATMNEATDTPRLLVQAKAKQTCNVTRELAGLKEAIEEEPF